MQTAVTTIDRRNDAAGRLLSLTWKAAARDLRAAEDALAAGDSTAAGHALVQVRRILLELIAALDPSVAPAASDALRAVYQDLFDRLGDPRAAHDPAALREIRATLEHVRQACGG